MVLLKSDQVIKKMWATRAPESCRGDTKKKQGGKWWTEVYGGKWARKDKPLRAWGSASTGKSSIAVCIRSKYDPIMLQSK